MYGGYHKVLAEIRGIGWEADLFFTGFCGTTNTHLLQHNAM